VTYVNKHKHYWAYCNHCECPMVICGNCGNNCCNGGTGQYADGTSCDICLDAYTFQDLGPPEDWVVPTTPAPIPPKPNMFYVKG